MTVQIRIPNLRDLLGKQGDQTSRSGLATSQPVGNTLCKARFPESGSFHSYCAWKQREPWESRQELDKLIRAALPGSRVSGSCGSLNRFGSH